MKILDQTNTVIMYDDGHVAYDASHYGVAANNQVGQLVTYRPLNDIYDDHKLLTPDMIADTRALLGLDADNCAVVADEIEPVSTVVDRPAETTDNKVCPHCGTYCYGDCNA